MKEFFAYLFIVTNICKIYFKNIYRSEPISTRFFRYQRLYERYRNKRGARGFFFIFYCTTFNEKFYYCGNQNEIVFSAFNFTFFSLYFFYKYMYVTGVVNGIFIQGLPFLINVTGQ